jgi:hypothetical protein
VLRLRCGCLRLLLLDCWPLRAITATPEHEGGTVAAPPSLLVGSSLMSSSVDVSGDGGVLKQTTKPGTGKQVEAGDTVRTS